MKTHCQQRQKTPIKWERSSVNHISNKGLTSRIHGELIKLNKKKKSNDPTEEQAKGSNRHFSREDTRGLGGPGQGARHHSSPGRCKSKAQGDGRSHPYDDSYTTRAHTHTREPRGPVRVWRARSPECCPGACDTVWPPWRQCRALEQ